MFDGDGVGLGEIVREGDSGTCGDVSGVVGIEIECHFVGGLRVKMEIEGVV